MAPLKKIIQKTQIILDKSNDFANKLIKFPKMEIVKDNSIQQHTDT